MYSMVQKQMELKFCSPGAQAPTEWVQPRSLQSMYVLQAGTAVPADEEAEGAGNTGGDPATATASTCNAPSSSGAGEHSDQPLLNLCGHFCCHFVENYCCASIPGGSQRLVQIVEFNVGGQVGDVYCSGNAHLYPSMLPSSNQAVGRHHAEATKSAAPVVLIAWKGHGSTHRFLNHQDVH